MHLKTGRYKNGYELYSCICGSVVQSRNLCNHFLTKKHKNFLFNHEDLINNYENLTHNDIKLKIINGNRRKMIERFEFPIILKFD